MHRRLVRKFGFVGLGVVLAATLFASGAAFASNPFVDIGGAGVHVDNIDAIYNAGISVGCFDSTHYCPNDTVTRAQMASFMARLGGLNGGTTRNYQKVNGRSDLLSYCTMARNNPKNFTTAPCNAVLLASPGTTNSDPMVVIDENGFPVVLFADASKLYAAECDNADCTSFTLRTVDTGSFSDISATTNIFGSVRVTYYDATTGRLRLARCGAVCTSANVSDLDGIAGKTLGQDSVIQIPTDGLPVVIHRNVTDGNLRVVHCTNSNCTAVDPVQVVAINPSEFAMTLGSDDLPVVTYKDEATDDLMLLRCNDVICSSYAQTTVSSAGDVGSGSSVIVGANGFPTISYQDATNARLRVAQCGNAACTVVVSDNAVPSGTTSGPTVMALGLDGRPVIVHGSNPTVIRCGNPSCSIATPFGGIGLPGNLVMRVDGAILGANNLTGSARLGRAPIL